MFPVVFALVWLNVLAVAFLLSVGWWLGQWFISGLFGLVSRGAQHSSS